ncbi:ABC transporter permease subunit [Paraburkholderia sp. J67]|uniref:ABC transporter permease n=1 Tax=Paraburkholderia sp. J67 TaxID=2805435 RepID=UPI002ABDBA5D|nr:ABC transporter permease subunit [Paraburkholderia sp. J67]
MAMFKLLGFSSEGWAGALLAATLMTVLVTFAALAIGAFVGSTVTWAKLSRNLFARAIGDAYTTVFRGVPELLILYLIYFGGSSAATQIASYLGADEFYGMPPFLSGAIAVGVISASYQTEVYRGAYLAVARGEIEAAMSLGMSRMHLFFRIVAPQILRFALPGLGNVWQMTLKDSALISITGLAELMRASQIAAGSTHQYFLFFITGGVLYLALTGLSTSAFTRLETHLGRSARRPA